MGTFVWASRPQRSELNPFRLNLTVANRIFILEPQWNPSIEVQAIARAQRMSQKQSVLVTRYVVRGTVEEVIMSANAYPSHLLTLAGNPETAGK